MSPALTGVLGTGQVRRQTATADPLALYVNGSTGSDARTKAQARSLATPWATLGRAAWGSTTRGSPNTGEAAAAGDTVTVAAGTYSTAGLTITGFGADRFDPLYNPANSGTVGSPITFRASGTVTLTHASAGPTYGADGRNYIIWDGFTVNEANAAKTSDTGPVVFFGCDHSEIWNGHLIGADTAINDNHPGIRIEQADFTRVYNTKIHGLMTLGSQGQNESAVQMYDSNDTLIEHCEFYDNGSAVTVKGIHPGETQDRTVIRYCLMYDTAFGIIVIGSIDTDAYQNVIYDMSDSAIRIQCYENLAELPGYTTGPRRNRFVNNTIYNCARGFFYDNGPGAGATPLWEDIQAYNNLLHTVAAPIYSEDYSVSGDTEHQHNIYYAGYSTLAAFGANNFSLTTWRNVLSGNGVDDQDDVSPFGSASDPGVTNAAGHDFHIVSGFALTQGRVLANIGGSTGATIPAGAYISGSETIGVA